MDELIRSTPYRRGTLFQRWRCELSAFRPPHRASEANLVPLSAEEAQTIENVVNEAVPSATTRRAILQRAAIGAAGATALGGLGPAAALAKSHGHDSVKKVGVTAITAEALAVTYLTEVVRRFGSQVSTSTAHVIEAANAEEQAHYDFLHKAGFKSPTKKFWIPDAWFASVPAVAATIEAAEGLFVNAYLIGITVFARAGNPTLARYAGEIMGVEAQHLALARDLQGKLPNNLAFQRFRFKNLDQVVGGLKEAGAGFGTQGKTPGAFYHYNGPGSAVVPIQSKKPS